VSVDSPINPTSGPVADRRLAKRGVTQRLKRSLTWPAVRVGRPLRPDPQSLLLAAILLAALALRVWSINHGLPFVYNPDEELHFVPIAVGMFSGSLNPGYFENPPALTYLLHAIFRLRFLEGSPFGASGFAASFRSDPEAAYITARVAVALLGTAVVALVHWAGSRFFDRRVGLVAAALIAFTFLPVFYSKQALNDIVTLAPLTVGLVGCLVVYERGRAWDWALAGGALGVATATKYTAGAMVISVGVAALLRVLDRRSSLTATLAGLLIAGVVFVVAFLVLNPYSLLDAGAFRSQIGGQSAQAGSLPKLGQEDQPGWLYYLWTLTWGFGWAPSLAALAGAALALRRDWRRAALLIAFPLVFFLFLGIQARFFGRWLLPAYPILAILAGYAAVRAVDAIRAPTRGPAGIRTAVLVGLGALLVAQGVISSIHVDRVLGRADTRTLARRWLEHNVPRGSRVVVEPFIPHGFLAIGGREGSERYLRFPVKRPFQTYEQRLGPELVGRYVEEGYCWVVVASSQKERGLKAGLRRAKAYYERLDRESQATVVFSPYEPGARPPAFNFDLSFNYLPPAYFRPGPLVEIHRLDECDNPT